MFPLVFAAKKQKNHGKNHYAMGKSRNGWPWGETPSLFRHVYPPEGVIVVPVCGDPKKGEFSATRNHGQSHGLLRENLFGPRSNVLGVRNPGG